LLGTVALEAGLAALGLGLGVVFGVAPLETLSLEPRAFALGALATLPMLAAFVVLERSEAAFLRAIRVRLEHAVVALFARASLKELALVCAAAGIGEEVLFRGFLQRALGAWMGEWPGLLAASVLFGAVHPVTPGYVVIASAIGIYLGGLWLATGNLLVPILAHGLYDFVALLLLRSSLGRNPQARALDRSQS
jgi:hypothetical protein